MLATINEKVKLIGNIVHPSVPVSQDEENNEVLRIWGNPDLELKIDGTPGKYHHHEILYRLGGYDPERGVKVAGHRGYFLTGPGMLLNLALMNYGINFLMQRKYTPVQPPFFLKKSVMAETAELADFD